MIRVDEWTDFEAHDLAELARAVLNAVNAAAGVAQDDFNDVNRLTSLAPIVHSGSTRGVSTGARLQGGMWFDLGGFALSPRETDVLPLLLEGRTISRIQETLFISAGTVSTHIRHIYQKTGVDNRQELIDLAHETAAQDEAV